MLTSFLTLLVAQTAASGPAPTPPPAPPTCEGANHEAFDFWIGEWDVYANGADAKVADSRIEKVSAGCAVRETWMPLRGRSGSSVSTYDPSDGRWHQLWIGGAPGRVMFDGGPVGETMVLIGYWGTDAVGNPSLVRMTYSVQENGAVRQYAQASSDHGVTWSDSFDFIYRRKE